MSVFKGSMVAIVTPFHNGKIDEASLRKLIDLQVDAGTAAIIPCGTTGESATLTHEEHERVVSITIEHVAGRAKVIAGAGSNATASAIQLHKYSYKAGADAALQITPYYNKPMQEGLTQHFTAIAKSADLPIILYNVPGRTGVNMLPETTIALSKVETIVGVKEASGKLEQAEKIIKKTGDEFSLLSGEDALNYELYKLGAKGTVSVTCNVQPKLCAQQYTAVKEGNMTLAKEIQDKLNPLHDAMFYETNPQPVKTALSLMGYIQEEYRLPLVSLSEQNKERLKAVLREQGLLG